MARVVLLWHLHQPEYRDPVSGQPILPWVRLHATRAYNDMAAALERKERARAVANWAPSLLLQLEAYASGSAVDRDEEIARKPVDSLTAAERAHLLRQDFSVDWEVWVKPVPRYRELLAKRGAEVARVDLLRAQEGFSTHELIDLQVHFMLAWMGFAARREHRLVAELVRKERGFTEAEKTQLLDVSRKIAAGVVPRWRALAARGSVEISCSPMFHPILPLLVDSDSARRAMPDAALPPRFHFPQDAREQIRRGLSRTERDFGVRPAGMWPSEGAVSPEVLQILGSEGVRWCATDQGNLERSELEKPAEKPLHHKPWMCGEVAVFFRDRELSDRVGFRYAKMEAHEAAKDLRARIAAAEEDATLTIALDGENPWEHYPGSGERFLDVAGGHQIDFHLGRRPDTTEHIVIEFDRPQTISGLVYEVEETTRERTQEVRVEASEDGGQSYRQILVQEYNFSPGGATYQREEQRFNLRQARRRSQRSSFSPRGLNRTI